MFNSSTKDKKKRGGVEDRPDQEPLVKEEKPLWKPKVQLPMRVLSERRVHSQEPRPIP